MLASERLQRGRGIGRAADRKTWAADMSQMPDGAVILMGGYPALVAGDHLFSFGFGGWELLAERPARGRVVVLTPLTSVMALNHGYTPTLHPSVFG
jgi:hypothetical protein